MSAQPYQPSALSDVTVSVDGDDTVVSFPRVLPYSVEKVWEAITDPEMLAQWTPYTADRNLSRTGDAVITMLTEDAPPKCRCRSPFTSWRPLGGSNTSGARTNWCGT